MQDGAGIWRGESAHDDKMLADMSASHTASIVRMNDDLEVALQAPVDQERVKLHVAVEKRNGAP